MGDLKNHETNHLMRRKIEIKQYTWQVDNKQQ